MPRSGGSIRAKASEMYVDLASIVSVMKGAGPPRPPVTAQPPPHCTGSKINNLHSDYVYYILTKTLQINKLKGAASYIVEIRWSLLPTGKTNGQISPSTTNRPFLLGARRLKLGSTKPTLARDWSFIRCILARSAVQCLSTSVSPGTSSHPSQPAR